MNKTAKARSVFSLQLTLITIVASFFFCKLYESIFACCSMRHVRKLVNKKNSSGWVALSQQWHQKAYWKFAGDCGGHSIVLVEMTGLRHTARPHCLKEDPYLPQWFSNLPCLSLQWWDELVLSQPHLTLSLLHLFHFLQDQDLKISFSFRKIYLNRWKMQILMHI